MCPLGGRAKKLLVPLPTSSALVLFSLSNVAVAVYFVAMFLTAVVVAVQQSALTANFSVNAAVNISVRTLFVCNSN